jgi:hypothetical protein
MHCTTYDPCIYLQQVISSIIDAILAIYRRACSLDYSYVLIVISVTAALMTAALLRQHKASTAVATRGTTAAAASVVAATGAAVATTAATPAGAVTVADKVADKAATLVSDVCTVLLAQRPLPQALWCVSRAAHAAAVETIQSL